MPVYTAKWRELQMFLENHEDAEVVEAARALEREFRAILEDRNNFILRLQAQQQLLVEEARV